MRLPTLDSFWTWIPESPLPLIRFPSLRAPPPMVLLLAPKPIKIPYIMFGMATSPVTSAPMVLPSTEFRLLFDPICRPDWRLPLIRLPAPGSVPPITLFEALSMIIP